MLVVVKSFRLESTFSSFGMDGPLDDSLHVQQGAWSLDSCSTWAQVARTDLQVQIAFWSEASRTISIQDVKPS